MNYDDLVKQRIYQEELQRREEELYAATSYADDFLSAATKEIPWQQDFVLDQGFHKALFGERRGAKSSVMMLAAIYTCLKTPYSKVLYIGQTLDSVSRTIYDEILEGFQRTFSLPAKLVGKDEMRFNNGSIIYLTATDASKKQKERVRGFKSSLNLIDEMQSHKNDTRILLNEVIGPTAADTKAPTIIGGTAGDNMLASYWFEITQNNTKETPIDYSTKHPEWKVYRCEWSKNTAIDRMTGKKVCDNVREYLEELKAKHPGIENTDAWEQEWNAKWVARKDSLVYHYAHNALIDPECIDYHTNKHMAFPPRHIVDNMIKVLALDIGSVDECAWAILGYNLVFDNIAYVIESGGKPKMIIDDIVSKLNQLKEQYHPAFWVGDSSNLTVFETLRDKYLFPFEKANRAGKVSHIRILNSDLHTRSVVMMPGNERLIEQLNTIQWDSDKLKEGKYEEDQRYKNDIADCFLYAHNYSRHMWYTAPKPQKSEGDRLVDAILQSERKQHSNNNNKNRLSPYAQNVIGKRR